MKTVSFIIKHVVQEKYQLLDSPMCRGIQTYTQLGLDYSNKYQILNGFWNLK